MRISHGGKADETWFREGCYITEWMNDPSDANLSVARARVPVGGKTRWHALDSIEERYVILSGIGEVEVGTASPETVRPADVVTIAPGQQQRITNTGSEDLIFLAICTPRFEIEHYKDLDQSPQ